MQIISPSRRILQGERLSLPRERETFMTTDEMESPATAGLESMTTAEIESCLEQLEPRREVAPGDRRRGEARNVDGNVQFLGDSGKPGYVIGMLVSNENR